MPKGPGSNKYELPAVYLIGILEFSMDDQETEQYFYDIALLDKMSGKQFYNKLGFKFLDLSTFVRQETELESYRDKWMYLLKHMSKMDRLPAFLNKRVFQKIFSIAEISKLNEEERMAYEISLKEKWDTQNAFDYVEKSVEKRVREEEQAKMHEERLNIARELKKLDLPDSDIAKATNLSIKEIETL